MTRKRVRKSNVSLIIMIIWLIACISNSLSQQVMTTPAFVSSPSFNNSTCWLKRFKRASPTDDNDDIHLYGHQHDNDDDDDDDLMLHQHHLNAAVSSYSNNNNNNNYNNNNNNNNNNYNNNMAYINMHQHSYQQHNDDFINSAFDSNDDSNTDSSLVGFGGLLPHELPEHDHIAHHLEMQTHEELLEDIRDDTVGINIIADKDLPKFGEPLQNVTVPVGREAVLQCVVNNLQTYKIAWLRVDTQTILTIQNHVITKNHRMSITHAEQRAWILRIRDVKESDKGWYMCQINTDPMKSQVGYLDVVVPPDILDYQTSTDMVIREGSNVTLKCAATGSPIPTITWRREGGELIPTPNGTEVISFNGSSLTIAKVNRLNMGAYLCIASNGIPPTVSKRIMLVVHFPPMIWIQNQLVGAALGQNVTLECQSEAFPKSINYWTKNETIIVPGERFIPETYESGYKTTMRLVVIEIDVHDFGSYRCVAKNSLGDTDGAIKLYHIPQTTTITTITPALSTNTIQMSKYNKEQRYNFQQHQQQQQQQQQHNNNKNKNNVIVNNNNNNNNNNNRNNNKLQRIKSREEFPQLQQQQKQKYHQQFQRHHNEYGDATSNVWNTQQGQLNIQQQQPERQGDNILIREQLHYNKNNDNNAQDAEYNNYNDNGVVVGVDYKSSLQHDAANSLILDRNDAIQNAAIDMSHNLTIVFYLSTICIFIFFHHV